LTVLKSVKGPAVGWLACAFALVALILVAYAFGPVERLDATLLSHLAAGENTAVGTLADAIAHTADPLPLVAMLAILCGYALHRGRPRDALAAIAVVAGANLTTQALKVLLAHPRYQPILGYHQVGSTAFPSGHATAAMSIALALLFVVPRPRREAAAALGTAYVLAVGCSVLILDWHVPSDVLGGILVAAGWGFAVLAALRLVERSGLPGVSRPGVRPFR
jgi:membrane-associated phospholipid phosphatase